MYETEAQLAARGRGRDVWIAGVSAGALAAIAMMAFMMAAAASDGSALDPLRAVGATFRGRGASGGAGALLWGIILHLVTGTALGVLFAAIVPRDMTGGAAAVLGGGCALILMGLAVTLVVPAVNPVLATQMPREGGSWVIAHALFGATLGLTPLLRRRFAERSAGRPQTGEGTRVLRPRTSG